ncbi:MAG: hypothetical protein LBR74_04665 [Eubacterium sp.]|jgi:succinate dehydrogenase hydrophobic anchor subunit|nr:hypothetical protein [Eubacterium sp.]
MNRINRTGKKKRISALSIKRKRWLQLLSLSITTVAILVLAIQIIVRASIDSNTLIGSISSYKESVWQIPWHQMNEIMLDRVKHHWPFMMATTAIIAMLSVITFILVKIPNKGSKENIRQSSAQGASSIISGVMSRYEMVLVVTQALTALTIVIFTAYYIFRHIAI